MKIEIIHPAHYRNDGTLIQSKKWYDRLGAYVPHLGPALLAALTPPEHEVSLIEEYLEDIDFDSDCDIVALSAQIMQYDRCKDISAKFRARGKKTILGGFLPTMLPHQVEDFFDAIVVGEGDEVWGDILRDIEQGRLKSRYQSLKPVDIGNLPVPRYDLIKKDRMVVYPVQATRGCPFKCDYCCISSIYKGNYRTRPVEPVLRDIEATGSKDINFCDDNLCEDVKFADKLFTAMAGSKIRWGTQTTINVARHPKLLRKAREAGCSLMALGVETLSTQNLENINKTFQTIDKFAEGFKRIADAGISPHALIIFGMANDNKETFEKTLEYLEKLKIPVAQFFLLMPYPGTPAGDKAWKSNKVFDKQLSHFREPYVVYSPELLTPQELHEGWWNVLERFYSLSSIFKRIMLSPNQANFGFNLAVNLYYWSKIKRGIHPVYFGN